MAFELDAVTDAGQRFMDAAASITTELREFAAQADQNNTMSRAAFTLLQDKGIAAAFVPEELGGMGVASIRDWIACLAKLAEGDGSVAIAINMHMGVSRGMTQGYRAAVAAGRDPGGPAAGLKAIAEGKMLICATATERGTDNLHPYTTAVRNEDGWVINGQKMFVTMSPIATHLAMNLRMQDDTGDHLATTMMPINTPGLEPQDDWDALGMRGSGSQSVVFNNVTVGGSAVRRLGPWGEWSTQVLINRTLANLTLVGAFFGIASHAREIALASLKKQKRVDTPMATLPGVQATAGEMEIEYAKCRSVLAHTGAEVDRWLAEAEAVPPTLESAHELMQQYQAAKWVVNRGAITIVDKALDLAGGGGFMNGNPLTRLYRDVRAGPFMQPHAATDIRNYVGQVALEQYPVY